MTTLDHPDGGSGRRPFAEGDPALLVDRRGRRYLISLEPRKSFHTHVGAIDHDDLIGRTHGARMTTSTGHVLLAFSPTLGDFVEEMPHQTQVIYGKDLGAIIMHGDVFPGARVLEAGLGSGALTIALLRAVGERGHVTTYEIRPELVDGASTNIRTLVARTANLEIKLWDVYEGVEETELDRIVLDVPEPWHVVPHAATALAPGGIFLGYLPTILQVYQLYEALAESPHFEMMETVEVLTRPWSVTRRSVRPTHRMIAHTGFITTARKCDPKAEPPPNESLPDPAPP